MIDITKKEKQVDTAAPFAPYSGISKKQSIMFVPAPTHRVHAAIPGRFFKNNPGVCNT